MPTLQLVVAPRGQRARVPAREQLEPLAHWFSELLPFVGLDQAGVGALLRDLAVALAQLRAGTRVRMVVPTEAASPSPLPGRRGAVWEVGLERDGDELLVSLFRQGADARVVQSDRRLLLVQAQRSLLAAIEASPITDHALASARTSLIDEAPPAPSARIRRRRVTIEGSRARFRLESELTLREGPERATDEGEVARTDLHALLFRGAVTFGLGDAERSVGPVHLFLAAEQLLALAETTFRSLVEGQPCMQRFDGGGLCASADLDARGRASLLFAPSNEEASARRLPAVPAVDLVSAVLTWCRRLGKEIVTADPSQRQNLRLSDFRHRARYLADALRGHMDAGEDERAELLHASPESFRAYVDDGERAAPPSSPARNKLRFDESWRADVPHLDLRALFVAGSKVVVGSPRELACIERRTGDLLWTQRTHQAVSVMTPAGCMRLGADGRLTLHELEQGESVLDMQLGPCVGASASGVVVSAPGLPTMVLLGEGARNLVAVDLDSGEVRWRRPVRGHKLAGQRLRLRRAGRLVLVATGDAHLVALDLLTGEVVWRRPSRFRVASLALDRGQVFVLNHDPRGLHPGSVEALDPFTGQSRWRAPLPRALPAASLAVTASAVNVLSRHTEGTEVLGLDRERGELLFDLRRPICNGRGACVAVDDLLIANSDRGELVALDTRTGDIRYRHVFGGYMHPDERPRFQVPVLRSGALFLPQAEVYVVCPHSGTMLGRLPCDLVPDALRADEAGGVYVAEASGYIAAYHALPTLSLVRKD